jgi:hypothetical protein
LSIREAGGSRRIPVEALNGRAGGKPIPVRLVLITEYRAGAVWRPREVTSGRALLCLMDNTIAARRDPAMAMAVLKQVVSGCQTLKGRRGEVETAVSALLRRLEGLDRWPRRPPA